MNRNAQPPEVDEKGFEQHPAFGVVTVGRVSSSHGQSLFDSEIAHQHFVALTISTAERKRDLNRDWIHPRDELIQIYMSEAQWAQMVSSLNAGNTPCTIRRTESETFIPEIPFAPRLALSRQEVHDAASKVMATALEKLAAYEAHPTKANLRALRGALEGATRNVDYTTQTLDEHVEKVVTKAKADVEAMVAYAQMHGGPLRAALGAGEDSDESYGAYARALGIGRDYDEQLTAHEDGEVL